MLPINEICEGASVGAVTCDSCEAHVPSTIETRPGWARAFRVAFVRDSVFGTAEILVLEGARGVDVHQYGTACQ